MDYWVGVPPRPISPSLDFIVFAVIGDCRLGAENKKLSRGSTPNINRKLREILDKGL